jgi:hypothetical protein
MQHLFDLPSTFFKSISLYDFSGVGRIEISEPQVARGWAVGPSTVRRYYA